LFSAEGEATKISQHNIWQNVQLIRFILWGAATLLPDSPEDAGNGGYEDSDSAGEPNDLGAGAFAVRSARVLEVPPVLSDVRDTLAQLLHQVVEKMETASYDKGLLLICKVYDMVLNYRGISANDFKWKKQFYRMGKVKYRSIASFQLEKKTLPRRLLGTADPQPPPPATFNLAVVAFVLQSKRATSNIFAGRKRGCGMFRILKLTSSFWMTWLDYPCIHYPRYGVVTAITTTKKLKQ